MANLFEEVSFRWKGRDYTIPANRVLRAIAAVENVVTLQELQDGNKIPLAKVSMAFGALLRFAGAPVSDDEVYLELWGENGADPITAINLIIAVMLPKKVRDKIAERTAPKEGSSSEGNVDAPTGAAS